MKITLESTEQFAAIAIGGFTLPARVWEGKTERGQKVWALVVRVAGERGADLTEFEHDLREAPVEVTDHVGEGPFAGRVILNLL